MDLWKKQRKEMDVLVSPDAQTSFVAKIQQLGITYEVTVQDAQV